MPPVRTALLPAVVGCTLAALVVALPIATGAVPLVAVERTAVEQPLGPDGADLARERNAGTRADAAVAAVLAQREAEARAAEQARIAAERAAAEAAGRASRDARRDPRSVARVLLAERGWADQFGCLDSLWTKESGWDHTATNPSSGAYGIPQSLPAGKMAAAGADWRTNPVTQMRWGLDYIDAAYGSPCGAWRQSQAVNWY